MSQFLKFWSVKSNLNWYFSYIQENPTKFQSIEIKLIFIVLTIKFVLNFLPGIIEMTIFERLLLVDPNVFIDHEHDHIGIVVENKDASIIVAEGNINNMSGVIERKKDAHIRAYIRLPDHYAY